jgi:hypothetical protein
MKKISANEFYDMIEKNPRVFEHWNTPLEITESVSCIGSEITHLSPHLTFSGNDKASWAADFMLADNLKNATGTFHGYVRFQQSGIEKIENLTITKTNKEQAAATFSFCKNLQIASGTYPGYIDFNHSNIQSIQNLHIKNPNIHGAYADFENCPNLQTLKGWDLSKEIWIEPEKLAAEKERRTLQKFRKENQPKELPFL